MVSEDRIREIAEAYFRGEEVGLAESTIKKYLSQYRKLEPEACENDSLFRKLKDNYTIEELKKLARAPRHYPEGKRSITFEGATVKFAFVTDTHFGAACFEENCWDAFLKVCEDEEVDFIAHAGDVCDGTPIHRMDTIFGMQVVGYANQKQYSRELLSKTDLPIYVISGNHDQFYKGARIVEDICETLPNCHYTGEDKGTITIHTDEGDLKILLWHGNDGNAGASYSLRVQKIIEGMAVRDLPHILLTGHTHKMCYIYDDFKDVHAFSGGALCYQSDWMRGKRLSNATGFFIIEATMKDGKVSKVLNTWYPLSPQKEV